MKATASKPNYASVMPRPSEQSEYKVRRGDSLWTIARKHGVTVTELKRANNLSTSTIRVGQTLTIPGGSEERHAE